MKQLNAGLALHLMSGATTLCTCWRLMRNDGVALGFTDHDRPLTFDGITHEAISGLTASETLSRTGFSVGGLEVMGALRSARLTEADLQAGLYDNAQVGIWRVNWADPAERVHLRTGHIGEVVRADSAFRAEVRGLTHALDQEQGRVYQPLCDAALGDTRCRAGLDDPAFRGDGQVVMSETAAHLTVSGLESYSDGWFTGGLLRFSSGANAGRAMEVAAHRKADATAEFELWQPMAGAIVAGDSFTVTAGCDKRLATCHEKFANALNFQGFPHIPGVDFMLSYPNKGEGNDGSNLR